MYTSYAHLDALELADELSSTGSSIDFLIGSDYYWNFVTAETKRGEEGPINETVDRCYITHSNLIIDGHNPLFQPRQDDILADTVKGFWETQSIGINELSTNGNVKTQSFEINVKQNGDLYEVKLPWK